MVVADDQTAIGFAEEIFIHVKPHNFLVHRCSLSIKTRQAAWWRRMLNSNFIDAKEGDDGKANAGQPTLGA